MACRLVGAKQLSEQMMEYFVNWTLGNKLQWNHIRNLYIFIQENARENVVRKMAAILFRPRCGMASSTIQHADTCDIVGMQRTRQEGRCPLWG